ncbi:MAG: hemolysin family protein [Proteobacteria bacterium]|nr:hemolysin family protein [Pseudomonadota bacterium]MBU1417305.1 hemolysin family protein [Pseudomonadota bacterium]MBU1456509.1 hemolysin family protein [Pseudomonadota bacterium]
MTKEKTDAPTGTNGHKSFFQRLAALLPLGRAPETTEALELEIQELLEEGEEQGLISSLEERMINSIFDFHDTLAVEVMTPSTEIVSAEESTPISDLVDLVIEKGFTRIPIYREKPDTIVGILHAKDLLKVCARGDNEKGVKGLLSPPYVINEEKPIVDLLREFQKRKIHVAVVADEFGTVRGLVTLEDLLEEIVGEIDDESDVVRNLLQEIDEESVQVKAQADIEVIEERFHVIMPEGNYESIGGLVIFLLGRLGVVGDVVDVEGLRFTVLSATERQIDLMQVSRLSLEQDKE